MRRAWWLLLLLTACTGAGESFRGTEVTGVAWGGDFTLTAHTGNALDTRTLAGKPQVLFFGFTHCPDICSPALTRLGQTLQALGTDAASVQVLFITVDPEHDRPEVLARFLGGFQPGIVGLTGTAATLERVRREYHVAAEKQAGGNIAHSGMVFVRDGAGKLRLIHREDFAPADLAHDLRLLLRR